MEDDDIIWCENDGSVMSEETIQNIKERQSLRRTPSLEVIREFSAEESRRRRSGAENNNGEESIFLTV
ncbi:hypothetical protein B9Z55_012207 [Caenorhabditis nigoni]|nr:hypothetical protein B9Z55_012207 [Caenorhabditis nigoni]